MRQADKDDQWAIYRHEDDPEIERRKDEWQRDHPRTSGAANGSANGHGHIDWSRCDAGCRAALTPELRHELATALGLPESVLPRLGAGWSAADQAWTFPECDGAGRIIGVNRRYRDGSKKVMQGGSRGLYIPDGVADAETLYVPEGASDVLAFLALGLPAVGRPSNTGGVDMLVDYVKTQTKPPRIVVVAEYDPKPDGQWPGRDGAVKTAGTLQARLGKEIKVRWVLPPKNTKDVREWVRGQSLEFDCADAWQNTGQLLAADLGTREIEARPSNESAAEATPKKTEPGEWTTPISFTVVPTVQAFPVDVLPAALGDLVNEMSFAMNVPTDFAAVPMLALAGGALANRRHLTIVRGHTQAPCLYAATVGHPGANKSAPLKFLRKPFDRAQSRTLDQWNREVCAWEEQAPRKRTEEDKRGPKPVARRFMVSDTTIESLGPLLKENPAGLVLVRDELNGLVQSLNQYKGGKGNDRQVLLSLWGGDTVIIDRKSDRSQGGAPLHVPNPFCGIVGTLQPDVVEKLRGDFARQTRPPDDGFLDRFLIVYPDSRQAIGERWGEITEAAENAWHGAIERLLALDMVQDADDTTPRPYFVHLSPDAKRTWERFTQAHADELNAEDFPRMMAGHWSKLKGYCARLSLIVQFLRYACGEVSDPIGNVDVESMARAVILVDYFKSHCRRVNMVMRRDQMTQDAERVVKWIRKWVQERNSTQFGKRDAYQALKGTFAKVEELEPVLEVVEKHGFIRALSPKIEGRGRGRPPAQFEINPSLINGDSGESDEQENLYAMS